MTAGEELKVAMVALNAARARLHLCVRCASDVITRDELDELEEAARVFVRAELHVKACVARLPVEPDPDDADPSDADLDPYA